MEPRRKKKVTAAIVAVLQHLAEAEETSPQPAVAAPGLPVGLRPMPLWGLAGRQDAMLLRSLWQRRLAKSW